MLPLYPSTCQLSQYQSSHLLQLFLHGELLPSCAATSVSLLTLVARPAWPSVLKSTAVQVCIKPELLVATILGQFVVNHNVELLVHDDRR